MGSTFERVRKAERIHWKLSGLAAFCWAGTLFLMSGAPHVLQTLLHGTFAPVVLIGLSGILYRKSRLNGRSRWLALAPVTVSAAWFAAALILECAPALNGLLCGVHGGFLVAYSGVWGLSRWGRIPALDRHVNRDQSAGQSPAHALESALHKLQGSAIEEDFAPLLHRVQTLDLKGNRPAEEDLAGAVIALDGLLVPGIEPDAEWVRDLRKVLLRSLERVERKPQKDD